MKTEAEKAGTKEAGTKEAKNRRKVGEEYEGRAADFLEKQGLRILERNFRCRQGEIDLIARDGRYLVFVEVKYRSGKGQGSGLEAVGRQKQHRIIRAAELFLIKNRLSVDTPCRFDVIAVDQGEIHWVPDAFGC
ncbi:MAG: YraN family protein [Blautia sp.]|nr:YraN family protein [Blautia sp.]